MKLMKLRENRVLAFSAALVLICVMLIAFSASVSDAAKAMQKTFASPEDAVKALVDAVKANNTTELLAILGTGSESLISSGDEVADNAGRERFVKSFEEMNKIEKKSTDKVMLHIGNDDYPMPIPIIRKGQTWHFDTKAGKEELLTRRIGRNELNAIDVMHAYVEAQREYVRKDWDGDGIYAYAQKLVSTPGKKDGLHWEATEGEEESPFGPFVAKAAAEGYKKRESADKPSPFHGYYFKTLKGQGKRSPGGAYDYVENGQMILGFGLVAYPAKYGSSGIMTFIVNQEGIVYQKNLGKRTAKVAAAMSKYDPDKTWNRVE